MSAPLVLKRVDLMQPVEIHPVPMNAFALTRLKVTLTQDVNLKVCESPSSSFLKCKQAINLLSLSLLLPLLLPAWNNFHL